MHNNCIYMCDTDLSSSLVGIGILRVEPRSTQKYRLVLNKNIEHEAINFISCNITALNQEGVWILKN